MLKRGKSFVALPLPTRSMDCRRRRDKFRAGTKEFPAPAGPGRCPQRAWSAPPNWRERCRSD